MSAEFAGFPDGKDFGRDGDSTLCAIGGEDLRDSAVWSFEKPAPTPARNGNVPDHQRSGCAIANQQDHVPPAGMTFDRLDAGFEDRVHAHLEGGLSHVQPVIAISDQDADHGKNRCNNAGVIFEKGEYPHQFPFSVGSGCTTDGEGGGAVRQPRLRPTSDAPA